MQPLIKERLTKNYQKRREPILPLAQIKTWRSNSLLQEIYLELEIMIDLNIVDGTDGAGAVLLDETKMGQLNKII